VKFHEGTLPDGTKRLESTNSDYGSSDRAFIDVLIYGDPVHYVQVTLGAFTIDSAGRFQGSALIDVMDSIDPGVKRWFVAQPSDPALAGLGAELDVNGLVAQISGVRLPITVLIVKTANYTP
jgi:hypothetical protein